MNNVAASVRARLLNIAKAQGLDFQQVLVRWWGQQVPGEHPETESSQPPFETRICRARRRKIWLFAPNKELRTFGTLGVLRHLIRDRATRFFLCQFKPEHNLNEDTLAHYQNNRLQVVPELMYSPWCADSHACPSTDTTPCTAIMNPSSTNKGPQLSA